MSRLFVAVWPPDEVLAGLADVERPRDQGVKWVPPENLHLTLHFLGDADEDEVAEQLADTDLPAAVVALGPAFDVWRERSLVVPASGLDDLAAEVRRATRGLGTEQPRRRFSGHLTVARLARRARPQRAAGLRFEARFDVREVALVASSLRDTGAEYETLAAWPTR